MVIVNVKEVIKVASNILSGLHRGINIHLVADLWEWWEHPWQNILLYLPRTVEVGLQRLELRMFFL